MSNRKIIYRPDDPVIKFRAALVMRRQMLVDQQLIVRRRPSVFDTPTTRKLMKTNDVMLMQITLHLKRIYIGVIISEDERRELLADLDKFIVRFQRSLNCCRTRYAESLGRRTLYAVKAALARRDDIDIEHPERTISLTVAFGLAASTEE